MRAADPLRKAMTEEEFWAQPAGAFPAWMIVNSGYVGNLNRRLGPGGTMRLLELLDEAGGLTPREAKPWFEVPSYTWERIERILYQLLFFRRIENGSMPGHLLRWVTEMEQQIGPPLGFDRRTIEP